MISRYIYSLLDHTVLNVFKMSVQILRKFSRTEGNEPMHPLPFKDGPTNSGGNKGSKSHKG